MRLFCCLLVSSLMFITKAQSYVDSGIQKYQVGEFEEAITFFNKGYELRDALPAASLARIFLYRGMCKLELLKSDGESTQAGITVENIYSDINNSEKYENVWPAKLEETKSDLYELAIDYADIMSKLARKENDFIKKSALYNDRIKFLKIASDLSPTSNINQLVGQTHKDIGDLYFESTEDLSKLQIAKQNYEEAIKYFEIARYDDPFSKEIIEALLELSKRLLDQERIDEYKKLLELAGG